MTTAESPGLGRRLAANTLHAASGRVVALLLWLALTPPMLRALGPEGFGVWSLFSALTGYLGALDLGFSQATLRDVAAARERGEARGGGEVATLALLGYLALGVLWALVLPLVREPVLEFLRVPAAARPGAGFAIGAGAVVFALVGLANTTIAVLQGSGRFDLANLVTLSLTLVQAGGIVLALVRHAGLPGVVTATGAGALAAWLLGLAFVRGAVRAFRWSPPGPALARVREVARFGGPMQLANSLAVLHQQVDKPLLARFVALAVVAPYELGLRVTSAATTFSQLLVLPVTPAAAALHAAGARARLHELHVRASRYVLVANAVVTAGLVASAPRLFAAWLGHAEPPAALALRGLAIAAYAGLAVGAGPAIARGLARTDLEAEFSTVALVLHVALALWLVPTRGLAGALVALVAGNVVGAAWFLARLAAVAGWPRARTLLAPLGVPFLALLAGYACARSLDHALPVATGAAAWPAALLVGALAAAITLGATVVARYLAWEELRSLLRPRRT